MRVSPFYIVACSCRIGGIPVGQYVPRIALNQEGATFYVLIYQVV